MKQVVIVAPHFPPSNLTAGHRSRYFAMHLPKFGWKVKVLSVDPVYYEENLDHELEALLPTDLEVVRTRAIPVRPLRLVGDISIRAFWWQYRALGHMVKNGKIDLVYIPMPPNYSSLLGYLAYRKFGIPYAVDYIDPWVHPFPGCEVIFSKAWFSYRLSRFFEPMALRHVSLITGVGPGYYAGALARYNWLKPSQTLSLPYGSEEEDFRYLDKHPRAAYLFDAHDQSFHIVYAGAMLPRAYSTLQALFDALLLIKAKDPSVFARLKIHFIGTGSNPRDPGSYIIKPLALGCGLGDTVFESPARIPYLDVLNHLKQAQAILILGSSEPHYTPSKVFQGILARRPVIALLHSESTAIGVLKEANAGTIVSFNEHNPAGACVEQIAQAVNRVASGEYSAQQLNLDALRAYSAESMTGKLAAAFDAVVKTDNYG